MSSVRQIEATHAIAKLGLVLPILLATALVLLLAVVTQPARAADLALCAGTETVTYMPAMKLATQSGTIANTDSFSCTGNDPGAASGSIDGSFPASYSCLGPLGKLGDDGEQTIAWTDGSWSTMDITFFTDNAVGGQYTFIATGRISAGKFNGATAIERVILPTLSALRCLTTGIDQVSGPLTLAITGP